jgi:ABC-type branched-subunit amino acid transport system permease subunit
LRHRHGRRAEKPRPARSKAAFDLNWVVAATFIVVIGGIGTVEGPIVGTAIFFALRWLTWPSGSRPA